MLFRIKRTLAGKHVIISISPAENKNYINSKLTNQLVNPEANIIKKVDRWNKKQYGITNLQLNIGDYTFISKFSVRSLWKDQSDVVLDSHWLETLGSILNTKKKFLTFSYKKKKAYM